MSMPFLLLGAMFIGQSADDPPVADRPIDFSNIVGQYDIKVTAVPTEVQVEEAIILKIEITGAGPEKYEPNRKYLRLFPESWKNEFYVQELPDQHEVLRDRKIWLFVYRLKPKHTKVDAIDGIKLVYYDPKQRDKIKYVERYADRIALKVSPKPERPDPVEIPVAAVPDSFFAVTASSDVLAQSSQSLIPAGWLLVLLVTVPPLACVGVIIAWRRMFPDQIQQARLKRDTAALRAMAHLQGGGSAWLIVSRYLRERLGLPVEDPTPAEVYDFLDRRGIAIALCEQARAFFERCDAVRYTRGTGDAPQLTEDACRLIQALEADPCA